MGAVRTDEGEQVLMRIFVRQGDRWRHRPLYMALIDMFRREGVAGATVVQGVAGFGADSVIHTMRLFRLGELPLIIEVVDSEDHINKVRNQIDTMMGSGLITMQHVRVTRYHETRS
jgi:PII-like signaling protein